MPGFASLRLAPLLLCAAAAAAVPPAAAQALPDLDVPFVTTPDHVVDAMLALAGVTERDFVLDLGSGDGRIVITAALKSGARGMGVEIDPALVRLSNENARKAGVADRARFAEQDLFATDLAQASVITMYLLPDVNLKLRPELLKLRPGTRIVSHDWDMGDWQPDGKVVLDVPDKKLGLDKKSTLLLWKIPAAVEGGWSSGKRLRLNLRQRYQMLEGEVTYRGQTYPAASGRVDGTRVQLCFAQHDTGRCRLGALGRLAGHELRLLIDGAGRRQVTVMAHRDGSR
ncbi:MAG: class I SAM-dependent methyltransferase [Burkholderiales bacterium]|nr:class I SAM-dependent methyltransferase [Burkholderiales bacterium]